MVVGNVKENARTHLIDLLRGVSALAVALFHFNQPYPALPDIYHRSLKWGWLGVPVFFVISGFCMGAARERDRLLPFWSRRLLRIFPPYWASIGIILVIVTLRIATTGINDVTVLPKSLSDRFYTLAALTSPATPVKGMNWAYWSLGYELAFYVLTGFLAFRYWPLFAGLLSVVGIFSPVYPLDQWGLFGLGLACHQYATRRLANAAIIGIPAALHCFFGLSLPQCASAIVASLLILFPPQSVLSSVFDPARAVGAFSYSLYLVHVPIGCYLIPHYMPFKLSREILPSILQDLILMLGSVASAYLLWRLVERPSHQLARRSFSRTQSSTLSPTPF